MNRLRKLADAMSRLRSGEAWCHCPGSQIVWHERFEDEPDPPLPPNPCRLCGKPLDTRGCEEVVRMIVVVRPRPRPGEEG